MTSVEMIVKQYLDRGYSLESLRLLAESREQPLAAAMLAVLDHIEAEAEPVACEEDSGPCETAAYPVTAGEEDMVFFVADDDEEVSEAAGIDFDVMADTASASAEESVAEILVDPPFRSESGETAAAPLAGLGENEEKHGLWNRLWTKVATAATPEIAQGPGPEPLAEAPQPEETAEEAESPADNEAETVILHQEDAVAETELPELEPVAEIEDEPAAQAEVSSDYLPEATPESAEADRQRVEAEKQRLIEAQRIVREEAEAAEEAVAEEPAAEEPVAEDPIAEEPPAEEPVAQEPAAEDPAPAETLPAAPAAKAGVDEAKKAARRERRRERSRKRKEQRAAAALAAADAPEFVLTRAEADAPSLHDDDHGTREFALAAEDAPEAAAAPLLPAPAEAEAATDGEEEDARPRLGEAMSLITPADVFEDDSQVLDPVASASDADADAGDHLMILANGGAPLDDAATENNVILFSENFPVFAGDAEDDSEDAADEAALLPANQYLHLLPPAETAEAPAEPAPEPAPAADALTDDARSLLVRMLCGLPEPEEARDPVAEAPDADEYSLIVDLPTPPSLDDVLANEAIARAEMEQEYQTRLDAFAARLLEMQTLGAASEARVGEKQAELEALAAEMDSLRNDMAESQRREAELRDQAAQTETALREKDGELECFQGMREEHRRLYDEFEDLRKAYNEVVSDVMPGLQRERDDLALTVERQCGKERELRSSLGSVRRRLAVGYSLGAAAALTLVALPVFNWSRSSGHERELAVEHQRVSELRENLQREVQSNITHQNRIAELENKVAVARTQITQLQSKNQELVRVQQDAGNGLAVFKPTGSGAAGTPTRASTMALQAAPQSGSRLHVNEVRDPAGSIEQVVADNRSRNAAAEGGAQLAQAAPAGGMALPIPLSSVARADDRNDRNARGALRPAAAAQPRDKQEKQPAAAKAKSPTAREGEVLATVKAGEGVAQVVYRQLGTWDPEVVSWVIRENRIKTDRRGNPVIHPNQVLRLPKEGRTGQAASAATRR